MAGPSEWAALLFVQKIRRRNCLLQARHWQNEGFIFAGAGRIPAFSLECCEAGDSLPSQKLALLPDRVGVMRMDALLHAMRRI